MKFALFERADSLRRTLSGEIERIGLSGTVRLHGPTVRKIPHFSAHPLTRGEDAHTMIMGICPISGVETSAQAQETKMRHRRTLDAVL